MQHFIDKIRINNEKKNENKKRGTRELKLTSCQKDLLKFLRWCLDLDLFGKANLTDLLGRMTGVLETLPKPLYNLSL